MPITWHGLAEYLQELATFPQTIAGDAGAIVRTRTEAAFAAIRAGYPVVTGTLRDGLTVQDATAIATAPRWRVFNPVIYARVFESGSAGTPAGKVFVPIVLRERAAMIVEVGELVTAAGGRLGG